MKISSFEMYWLEVISLVTGMPTWTVICLEQEMRASYLFLTRANEVLTLIRISRNFPV